jgi:hypothetical protein
VLVIPTVPMPSTLPDLLVLIEGDPSRVYRTGDKVKGKAVLTLKTQEQIRSFKINFIGGSIAKTTRPLYVTGENEELQISARKEYQEQANLFNHEGLHLENVVLGGGKTSYPFEFTFPERTQGEHSRWVHGPKFSKDPHTLPPSFHINTNSPGGKAAIAYFVQATLAFGENAQTKKVRQTLAYLPSLPDPPLEARTMSRVLYGQTLRPMDVEKSSKTAIDKFIQKVSHKSPSSTPAPRIIPILRFPDQVTPGQLMPLSLALMSICHSIPDSELPECTLDSFTMILSTVTTTMCGRPLTQPQDTVVKDVTCVSRRNINLRVPLHTPVKLTTNLRLVDDDEAVPSFRSYIISRHYTITSTIGFKCNNKTFIVRTTTPLQILPRDDRIAAASRVDEDGVPHDPLPLYAPREPSSEEAPDYEEVMRMMESPSTGPSTPQSSGSTHTTPYGSSTALSSPWSTADADNLDGYGFPVETDRSAPNAMTPVDEIEGLNFDEFADVEERDGTRRASWFGRAARRLSTWTGG